MNADLSRVVVHHGGMQDDAAFLRLGRSAGMSLFGGALLSLFASVALLLRENAISVTALELRSIKMPHGPPMRRKGRGMT